MRVTTGAEETFRLFLDVKMSNLRDILEKESQLRKQENFDDEERKVDDRLVLGKSQKVLWLILFLKNKVKVLVIFSPKWFIILVINYSVKYLTLCLEG